MKSLKELITAYFPGETVVSEKVVRMTDKWSVKVGRIPTGISKSWYLRPIPFVETKSYLFFDKRPAFIFHSVLTLLIGPFWMGGFVWIIFTVFYKQAVNWHLIGAVALLAVVVGILNTITNIGATNIMVIKKDWIDKQKIENGQITITGKALQSPYFRQVLSSRLAVFNTYFVINYQEILH